MPIYEYVCDNCGHITEKLFMKIQGTPDEIDCEKCGELAKKKVSLSRFKLKGFGWAFDGYDVTSNSVKNNKAKGKEQWNEKKKQIYKNREKLNKLKRGLG